MESKLEELRTLVETARTMPMSATCMINRDELLALVDELRELLPAELSRAEWVLKDREDVLAEGRREAEAMLAAARAQQHDMLSANEIAREARAEAERVLAEAHQEAAATRLLVDDYVDVKLANFEVVLHKTLAAVERGREKLRGKSELEGLGELEFDDAPLPG